MLGRLIAELQSKGLRSALDLPSRRGGAGPSEAGVLVIEGTVVSVPVTSPFVFSSPYEIRLIDKKKIL